MKNAPSKSPIGQMCLFWKNEPEGRESLAGTFARKLAGMTPIHQNLISAISRIINTGDNKGCAHDLVQAATRQNTIPVMRTVTIPYAYDRDEFNQIQLPRQGQRAQYEADVKFYVLVAHENAEQALDLFQAFAEELKKCANATPPVFEHVNPKSCLGDLCRETLGMMDTLDRNKKIPKGVFDRTNGLFASTDANLIEKIRAEFVKAYPEVEKKKAPAVSAVPVTIKEMEFAA